MQSSCQAAPSSLCAPAPSPSLTPSAPFCLSACCLPWSYPALHCHVLLMNWARTWRAQPCHDIWHLLAWNATVTEEEGGVWGGDRHQIATAGAHSRCYMRRGFIAFPRSQRRFQCFRINWECKKAKSQIDGSYFGLAMKEMINIERGAKGRGL